MRRGLKKIIVFITILAGIVCGGLFGILMILFYDLPEIKALGTYRPPAISRIYSEDRVLLAEIFSEKRDPVPLALIPQHLKQALIATEDRNFYKHTGIDIKGIARAVLKDIWMGEFVQGASTITQQLAKTLFLTPQKTITRKIKEALLSFDLERRFTKDEILELYLNQVYFGSGAYGVGSAARIFFGRPLQTLSLSECALIASLPKAPSRYSPLVNLRLAEKRRNIVLKQMLDAGFISKDACQNAVKETIRLTDHQTQPYKAPYFVEYVKSFLEDTIGFASLYKGGVTIHTTLSYELQQTAEKAVSKGLADLETRMQKNGIQVPNAQGALISLEVSSGKILAMVGGRDFNASAFNRAISARRQPGSAFKPLIYACAIERGFPQSKTILDAPVVYKGSQNSKDWRPENFSQKYRGEITLRQALALSENIPAVRLIERLGPASVVDFARKMGIQSELKPNLSLALGTSEVTLLEITSAYAVISNKGNRAIPFGVSRVVAPDGRIIWQAGPQNQVVMSRSGAAVMTDMLEAVIREGTARRARHIKIQIAGKTGTTNDFKDALFIGFSPTVATGVWMGRDDSAPLGKGETGAVAALPVWIEVMERALTFQPHQYFDIPDDVIRIPIDPTTGQVSPETSPNSVKALFKKGTEPKQPT